MAGASAKYIGAPWTLFIGGILCITAAYFFYRRLPALKALALPVLKEKGYR
jgi:hypothetical protein